MNRQNTVKLIIGHIFSEICAQRQQNVSHHFVKLFSTSSPCGSSASTKTSLSTSASLSLTSAANRNNTGQSLLFLPSRKCSDSRVIDLKKNWLYFDTHALVKKLQASGLTLEQSEAITEGLVETMNAQLEHQEKLLVTKSQQEITVQQLLANIATVRKDMLILEKSEFSALRNDTEKQTMEIKRTKQMVADEISKLKGQIALDINLEKSRAKEAHAEGERERSKLNNRIDMEVANLRTIYEQYRNEILKYAGGM